MTEDKVTFANYIGELLAPVLIMIRSTGFFEAYVFIPVMTLLSIFIFIKLLRVKNARPPLVRGAYYSLCFIMTNAAAVALKTLIVEEMDYESKVWYLHLVAPLHVFIVSVAGAFLWLIWRNSNTVFDRILCVYIQLGMLGGYSTAIFRLINEPFDFTDITTGLSGVVIIMLFVILNGDLLVRFKNSFEFSDTEMQRAT
jgi:hypothetical protein